jgi:hypothetical protein
MQPGTNIHLSYQLPMNQGAVNLPANAFGPTPVQPDESNLFGGGNGPPGPAQLQAISSRLAQASANLSSFKSHKMPTMLPPQIGE